MNIWWIFLTFAVNIVAEQSGPELTINSGNSQVEVRTKNIGRIKYRDGEVVIAQNQFKNTEFFFGPFPYLQPEETQCHENAFTDRVELALQVELYTPELIEAVKNYLSKYQPSLCGNTTSSFMCDVFLLPMNSIRLFQKGSHSQSTHHRYILEENWQSATLLLQSIGFVIYTSNMTVCEQLRTTLTEKCRLPNFEVQYSLHGQQTVQQQLVVNTEHVTNTNMYNQIRAQFPSAKTVFLTDDDFKELLGESIEHITMTLRMQEEFESLQDTMVIDKYLGRQLSTRQVRLDMTNEKLWGNLYWTSEITRPDRFAKVLNSIIRKDGGNSESFIYDCQAAQDMMKADLTRHDISQIDRTYLTHYDKQRLKQLDQQIESHKQSSSSSNSNDYHDDTKDKFELFERLGINGNSSHALETKSGKSDHPADISDNQLTKISNADKLNASRTNKHTLKVRSIGEDHLNTIQMDKDTKKQYTLTRQDVVKFLHELSYKLYLEGDTIEPRPIDARLVEMEKLNTNTNTKLFSSTVLLRMRPNVHSLPLRCKPSDTNGKWKLRPTDRVDRIEDVLQICTNHAEIIKLCNENRIVQRNNSIVQNKTEETIVNWKQETNDTSSNIDVRINDLNSNSSNIKKQGYEDPINASITLKNSTSMVTTTTTNNDCTKIDVADSQAFNNSFIQQRQQAITDRSYRSAIESWRPKSLQELVDAIKSLSNKQSLIDLHWMIFYWITYNIEYDTVAYFSNRFPDQSAETVFRRKKGVCDGYSKIYQYLCDQLNIVCKIVVGHGKGYDFDDRGDISTETNHAWNAVQIDHRWYLMEATWGAGSITNKKNFQPKLNSYYFFSRPNELIYDHLPKNETWQLLRKPIQVKQYLQMPKVYPSYFELNLHVINPCRQADVELLPRESYALILIRASSDVRLMINFKLNEKEVEGGHQIIFDHEEQLYRCYFAPNTVGQHKITILGKRDGINESKYQGAIEFNLNIKQMPKNPVSYSTKWQSFFDLNLTIVSPTDTYVIKTHNGRTHAEVLIQAPEDVELLGGFTDTDREKINGGHEISYDRHKGLWRCRFAPNRDGLFNADIYAKRKSDTGSYRSAISFKIDARHIPTPPLSYPQTWQPFYDLNLRIEAPQNRADVPWRDNTSFSEIRLSAPDDVQFLCGIKLNESSEGNCLVQFDNDKQQWQLLFAPERTGLHKLSVFARQQSSIRTSYDAAIRFDLNVTTLQQPIKFPTLYSNSQLKRFQIYEPINGVLKKGAIVPMHFFLLGARDVGVQVDSKWVTTERYEDPIFKTTVTVGFNDVIIYARFGNNTLYSGVVRYSVE